jgi:peptide/nickel transport system substrate-binding protein
VRRTGRSTWLVVLLLVMTLVAAACGSSKKKGATGSTTTTAAAGKKGGSIVVAAEQWPLCLNPITSCENSSWMHWVADVHVLPKLMELTALGTFQPSPVLVEAPSLTNGDIKTSPNFQVTFKIKPNAVWDDGTPITSLDVKFTWQAYLHTTGTLSTTGYDKITGIDTTDPKKAVVTFSQVDADWGDVFGGNIGYVLKKAAFKGVDTKDDLLTGIPFSGGPWKLQSWSKDQSVLVRNDKFWDKSRMPLLDQVTIVPRADPNTEINSLLTGEAVAAYPQPSIGLGQRLQAPNVKSTIGAGSQYEALWFNVDKPPVSDVKVRLAFAYAVDRQAIITNIVSQIVPGVKVLNCAAWVPTIGKWCDNTQFANFTYNPAKAKSILQADGWTMGSDGIFAKDGKKLTIEWSTVAGNTRRESTQQLVAQQAKAAGIALTFRNSPAGELFENRLPSRDFMLGEFANVASPDPAISLFTLSKQIPTAANGKSGQNYYGVNDPEVDRLDTQANEELDTAKRLQLVHQLGARLRALVPWIPLYQLPLVTAWRSDKLAGPVGTYTNSSYSGFFNMYAWYLK